MNKKASKFFKQLKRDLRSMIRGLEKSEDYYTQLINSCVMPWQLHYQNLREIVRLRLGDLYAVMEDIDHLNDLLEVEE